MPSPELSGGQAMGRRAGGMALAILMLLASSGLAAVVANQVYEASRLVTAVLMPMNPLETSAWQRSVVLVPRVLLVVLLFVWLGAVMSWMHYYVQRSRNIRRLWGLFARTTVVELAILAVASVVRFGLPSFG